jgi:T5SS/PEP-CTERM-associated repeat protein
VSILLTLVASRWLRKAVKFGLSATAALALTVSAASTQAAVFTWINFGSGNFNSPSNWFPSVAPGANDFVSFEVGSGNPYTVTFPGNPLPTDGGFGGGSNTANFASSHLRIRDNGVKFAGSTQGFKGQSKYTIGSTTQTEANRGIIIGLFGGENASLTLTPNTGIVCCGGFASLSGVAATLGDSANAAGTLNVGTGAFNVTGSDASQRQLIVGNHGVGAINLMNGGDVNVTGFNSTTSLGNHADGTGTVNINGVGSTWTSANQLWIGEDGDGTLTIENGGSLVTNGSGGTASTILGTFQGSSGTLTITGPGSTWTSNSRVSVGNSGEGSLRIENGGTMNHTNGFAPIVIESRQGGHALVTGAGSTLNTVSALYVGSTGNGSLAILSGGSVTSGYSQIRGLNGATGQVFVNGAGSKWNVTQGLRIGMPEPGFSTGHTSLTVGPGAAVDVADDIVLDVSGFLDLQGGTLSVDAIRSANESDPEYRGFFGWGSGTLHASEVYGPVTNEGGVLAPGRQMVGRTEIYGNYAQEGAATLAMELGGTLASVQHDYLAIEGFTYLDGSLDLTLVNGFVPTAGHTLTIVDSLGPLSGAFNNVAPGQRLTTLDGFGSFQVDYGAGSPFETNNVVLSDFQANDTADFDGDGDVDSDDLVKWQAGFGSSGNGNYRSGDRNRDGNTDGRDFLDWQRGRDDVASAPAAAGSIGAVPEPATLMLAGVAAIGLAVSARRSKGSRD